MTHAMFRDEEARVSVPGRRAAGRSGSGVVLTIGSMLTTSLVWRQVRALLFAEFGVQGGVECFLDDSASSCQRKRRNTLRGPLVVSPPTTRTDADDLMEGASERGLIREACLFRNVGQRLVRVDQELLGTFNPALHEPAVSRDTEACLE